VFLGRRGKWNKEGVWGKKGGIKKKHEGGRQEPVGKWEKAVFGGKKRRDYGRVITYVREGLR